MSTDVTRDFAFGLPKAELHLLHGALSDVHAVLAGEGQLQIRLKRALQV